MAIIQKCGSCKKRIREAPCPCGIEAAPIYYVDMRPEGRYGRRLVIRLPEEVREISQAQAIERDLLASRSAFKKAEPIRASSTVADLFPDYLEWYELHRGARTHKDLAYIYERHLKRILGPQRVIELSVDHAALYQRRRKLDRSQHSTQSKDAVARGVSNRTINKELAYFSGFLSWCRRSRGIAVAPLDLDPLPARRPIPIVLTMEEVGAIMAATDARHRVLFLFLYTMGLRFSEAAGLKWEDLDLAAGTARMRQKGGSYKLLPLNEVLLAEIKNLDRKGEGGYMFPSPRGQGKKPLSDIRKALDGAVRRAKIQKRVTPHLFRHSWATHLMGAGVNMRLIQKFMGHRQLTTTEFYTHVQVEDLRTAAAPVIVGLGGLFPQKSEENQGDFHAPQTESMT